MRFVNESCRLNGHYACHDGHVKPLKVIHSSCISSKDDHSSKYVKQVDVCQRKKCYQPCKCRRSWI